MQHRKFILLTVITAITMTASGLAQTANSIRIDPGTQHDGSVETRNSPIEIGNEATVNGNVQSRNGSIHVGDFVTAQNISTRNGSIRVGQGGQFGHIETRNGGIEVGADSRIGRIESRNGSVSIAQDTGIAGHVRTRNGAIRGQGNVRIDGDAGSRNGTVQFAAGSEITGSIATRNGKIDLTRTVVGRDLKNLGGGMIVRAGSRIGGNVVIDIDENVAGRRSGWFGLGGQITYPEAGDIRILDGSVVSGDVILLLPANYNHEDLPTIEIDSSSSVLGKLRVDHRVTLIVNGTVQGEIERVSP